MPKKQRPPNPELQRILMMHRQRAFYWGLVPFVMGCMLLFLNQPMGWFACIGTFLYWAIEPLGYSRNKSKSFSQFREDRRLFHGFLIGVWSPILGRMLTDNTLDKLGPDNRFWFWVVAATLLTYLFTLEGNLMARTSTPPAEPTG